MQFKAGDRVRATAKNGTCYVEGTVAEHNMPWDSYLLVDVENLSDRTTLPVGAWEFELVEPEWANKEGQLAKDADEDIWQFKGGAWYFISPAPHTFEELDAEFGPIVPVNP